MEDPLLLVQGCWQLIVRWDAAMPDKQELQQQKAAMRIMPVHRVAQENGIAHAGMQTLKRNAQKAHCQLVQASPQSANGEDTQSAAPT
jgi:hypothetical protein